MFIFEIYETAVRINDHRNHTIMVTIFYKVNESARVMDPTCIFE